MTQVETAASAEAHVERARAELAATLDQLKHNLRPSQLIDEALARPRDKIGHWLAIYGRFAKHSPLSGLIIGAAALAISSSVLKRDDHRTARDSQDAR